MKRFTLIMPFFVSALLSCTEPPPEPVSGPPPDTSLCGPESLRIVLESRGVACTTEELGGLAGYDPNTGTTMLGLHDAARAKGVPVAPVRIGISELCRMRGRSIAFVDGNHFLVVCGCRRDRVILEDPFTGRYLQSSEEFRKRWNGELLVFGESARAILAAAKPEGAPAADGPRIRFDSVRRAFGTVNENSTLEHTFPFRNTGSDTLTVTVRSTCSCTAALLSDRRIPPGGTGKIRMEFKTEHRLGPVSQSIHVRTNDLSNPMLTLSMTAAIRGTVKVVPDRIRLDGIASGETITREVLVVDPGDGSLEVENVGAPDGVTVKTLPFRKEKSGLRAIPLEMTFTGGDVPGEFEKTVFIRTNDRHRREIALPVSGTVRSGVMAYPPRIFFGEVAEDSGESRRVILSGTDGGKLGAVRAEAGSPQVAVETLPLGDGMKYTLVARLQALRPRATVRDSVAVYLGENAKPSILIPLYAKVK